MRCLWLRNKETKLDKGRKEIQRIQIEEYK